MSYLSLFLAGAIGAYFRLLADKGVSGVSLFPPRITQEGAVQMFAGGLSMAALGLIPPDALAELVATYLPILGLGSAVADRLRGLAGLVSRPEPAALIGLLGGYAGLDLVWLLRQRFPTLAGLLRGERNSGPGAGPTAKPTA